LPQNYTSGVLDTMSPLPPEEGGAAVQQGLKTTAQDIYRQLDEERGNTPIPGASIVPEQARQILESNRDYYAQHPQFEPTQAMVIVRNLAGNGARLEPGPRVIPGFGPAPAPEPAPAPPTPGYTGLHRLRSDLLDFNVNNPDLVRNQANAWIGNLAHATDEAIMSGEGGLTPEQGQLFRRAGAAWRDMKNTYDNPQSPLYQAVRTTEPSRLLTTGISRTPGMAANLTERLGPAGIGPIQRGIAESTLGTTPTGSYNFRNAAGRFER
jgi:hypothetical protein